MEGDTPMFDMDDPVVFPIEDAPPDGEDPETWKYWEEVNRKADKIGVSTNEARRMMGEWPPDWPRGADLARAVLNGTFDPKAL